MASAIPFHIPTKSYLADTNHLTTLQHGAYLLLLIEAWRNQSQSLPLDDALLSRVTRLDRRTWQANKAVILSFADTIVDGRVRFRHVDVPRLTPSQWKRMREIVFERDEYICSYCAKEIDDPHCDHITPKSRGGTDDISNLTTACRECNIRKGARTPHEWMAV